MAQTLLFACAHGTGLQAQCVQVALTSAVPGAAFAQLDMRVSHASGLVQLTQGARRAVAKGGAIRARSPAIAIAASAGKFATSRLRGALWVFQRLWHCTEKPPQIHQVSLTHQATGVPSRVAALLLRLINAHYRANVKLASASVLFLSSVIIVP